MSTKLWFAWHPVTTVSGRVAWLRWVEPRYIGPMVGTGDFGVWEYKLPSERWPIPDPGPWKPLPVPPSNYCAPSCSGKPTFRVITNGERFRLEWKTADGWEIVEEPCEGSLAMQPVDFGTRPEAAAWVREYYGKVARILPAEWRA